MELIPRKSFTIIFPPLINQANFAKRIKRQAPRSKKMDLKLLPELSLEAFKNLLHSTIKQFNHLTIEISEADILFPLGTPPFLYLQHLKEQHQNISFLFLISQNLLSERLYQRFFKIPILFENIIFVPLNPKNLPFKNKLEAKNFFLSLNENQRLILRLLVRAQDIPWQLLPDQEYLEKLKIINKHYGSWRLISPLLEQAALEVTTHFGETLKLKGGQIYIGRQNITNQFSPAQQKIITLLLKARRRVVSREKIAKNLWGKDYLEKYSDWAIDQMISKLRKKLAKLWINPKIINIKKRKGFFLVN